MCHAGRASRQRVQRSALNVLNRRIFPRPWNWLVRKVSMGYGAVFNPPTRHIFSQHDPDIVVYLTTGGKTFMYSILRR